MVKRLILSLLVVIFSVLSLSALVTIPVAAAGDCNDYKSRTFFLMPTWYKYLDFKGTPPNCSVDMSVQIVNDATGELSSSFDYSVIWKIMVAITEMLLILAGLVAVAFTMVGAFQFATAQGSPDKVVKARQTLTNGIVGAIIAVLASRVVGYIANKFASPDTDTYGLVTASANQSTITTVFNIALTVLGAISVLVLVISGIQFILSSSNPDKVAKARNAIYYALTGIAVAVFGAAIINFVIGRVT